MEIKTNITIDTDDIFQEFEDQIIQTAREVCDENDNNYQTDDDVVAIVEDMSLCEDRVETMIEHATYGFIDANEAQELIDECTLNADEVESLIHEHLMDAERLTNVINEKAEAITILKSRVRVIEGYLNQVEARRPMARAKRAVAAVKALPSRIHFYSPFMKGR